MSNIRLIQIYSFCRNIKAGTLTLFVFDPLGRIIGSNFRNHEQWSDPALKMGVQQISSNLVCPDISLGAL